MMITIMLENPGDWAMVGESRSGDPIKSDVKNFIAGSLVDVDKGHRRFKKKQMGIFILSSSIKYMHPSFISQRWRQRMTNRKADRANTSSTTIPGPHRTTGATSSFPTRTSHLGRHGPDGPSIQDDWPKRK